jgi:hypothetical protein
MAEPILQHTPPHSLPAALQAMNSVLRSGDILAIAPIAMGLERSLTDTVPQLPNHLQDLRALRRLAQENQVLLDAVGRGLRLAAARLAEISDAKRGLRTYGPGGATRAWVDQTGQGKRF